MNADKEALSKHVDKLVQNFTEEVNYNLSYQVMQAVDEDWATDIDDLNKIDKTGKADLAQYKTMIKNAMNKFLSQYTGDGSDIESAFDSYIKNMMKTDESFKAITNKYNNDDISVNAQQDYDRSVYELDSLESGGKNDKETQSKKTIWNYSSITANFLLIKLLKQQVESK